MSSVNWANHYGFYQGISPYSDQLHETGTGTGQFFNVTNNTGREQTYVFQSKGVPLAVMTLQDGETGTFEAGPNTPEIRITTSDAQGRTNPNQLLFEDHIEIRDGKVFHNPDFSKVDGILGYDGRPLAVTGNDGIGGHVFGDGTTTGSYDYDIEDQVTGPTNPMSLAQNPSNTYNLVFYDPI